MTVQEVMERAGVENTTLALAWIKDAIVEIQSSEEHQVSVDLQTITDGTLEYDVPADLIALNNISMLDTDDDQYKSINRLAAEPIVQIDNSP
tara:strand:- start:296 stop:571 length:276 start_codon:yes stop_codon:yes gene_type:complete